MIIEVELMTKYVLYSYTFQKDERNLLNNIELRATGFILKKTHWKCSQNIISCFLVTYNNSATEKFNPRTSTENSD